MANTPNLKLIELIYDNTKKVKDFFMNEIIGKTNSNNTKIDTAIAEKITQVALKSSLPTSPTTHNNLYIVYRDTKNNNGQYRWNGTTYEKISTQLDYATKAEAEAGADNTKVMTPQRVRDFFIASGGESGGVTNVVFQSGKKYYKFTATAVTDNFEIPSNLFNPTTDVVELVHGGNIPLIKDENYTLVGNLVTFMGYSLDANDDIHCLITNTAYSYNALVDTPDLSLKQNKTDNTLGTTSKEIVGAINENKYNIDLKADKPIVIGGSGNIRLIGEIVNYTTFNGFNLEAMLHNAHQTNFSQTNNAFIAIGKYDNNTAIEGKLQMLYDTVYNNPSGYYKSTIQVTDTGKIYAINETYMTASSWNIIKKTDNVVIYNNPTIVSSIDGNVIWDSELNKTNIATSQQMEQKADMMKMSMHLNTVGWKRFATSDIAGSQYGFAIFQLGIYYNDDQPLTTTFIVNKSYHNVSITPIGTAVSGNNNYIIPKLRAVYYQDKVYLELYYSGVGSNFTHIQMSNNLNFTLLDNFVDGSIPSGYLTKEVLLSNSVTTTDKIDISSLPFAEGFTDFTTYGQRTHYTKDSMGLVKVYGFCQFSNTQKIDWGTGKIIAYMPNGYKPKDYNSGGGYVLLGGVITQTQYIPVTIGTVPFGAITMGCFDYTGTNNLLIFSIEYYAE